MYNYPYFNQIQPNYNQNFNQPQPQAQSQDERIFVSNQQAAESFLLAPGGFVRLWDSSDNKFYEKRADATGRALPMDVYEYKRVTPQKEPVINEANKLSFDELKAEIEAINERIDKLEQTKKGAVKNATKSNADDTSV